MVRTRKCRPRTEPIESWGFSARRNLIYDEPKENKKEQEELI